MMSELAGWENFYLLVGAAAGTLIGLQFIAITLLANRPPIRAAEASAAFGSPTIVHFSAALFLSALLSAPWQTITIPAALWGFLGFSGVVYGVIVVRRILKQVMYKPVFVDWVFFVVVPFIAYAVLAISSIMAFYYTHEALFGVGAVSLLLLFIGIHNVWDSVTYHVLVYNVDANTGKLRDKTSAEDRK